MKKFIAFDLLRQNVPESDNIWIQFLQSLSSSIEGGTKWLVNKLKGLYYVFKSPSVLEISVKFVCHVLAMFNVYKSVVTDD